MALAIALRPAPPVQAVMILTGFGMLISSIGVDLFSYLQKGDVSTPEWIFRIEAEIDQLRKSQLVYSEQGLSEHDREQLRKGLFQHLTEAELKDAIYQAVDRVSISTIVERIAKEKQLDLLRQYYDGVIGSLDRQILDLGRRANLNLVMGATITVVGIVILSYFVFYAVHPSSAEKIETAIFFGTRLTLVVFIEIFAYFFLRLYRYSLFEIKYFQNEITNARFKIVVLEACSREGSKATLDKMCLELVRTERNFILKKGETTLSLRRDEIEQMSDSALTRLVERMINLRGSTDTLK